MAMISAATTVLKLVSKGFASKGAEAVGKGMKSLGDNSRDFLAASMAMEQVGNSFGVSGPAMGILAGEFQSATMGARLELMTSLMSLIQSEGGKATIDAFAGMFNVFTGIAVNVVDGFTDLLTYLNTNSGMFAIVKLALQGIYDVIGDLAPYFEKVITFFSDLFKIFDGQFKEGSPYNESQKQQQDAAARAADETLSWWERFAAMFQAGGGTTGGNMF